MTEDGLLKYWESLRRDGKCSAEEALWILLDTLRGAEAKYCVKAPIRGWYLEEPGKQDFFDLLQDFKVILKGRIRVDADIH